MKSVYSPCFWETIVSYSVISVQAQPLWTHAIRMGKLIVPLFHQFAFLVCHKQTLSVKTCYVSTWVPGILFQVEKKIVVFHSKQSSCNYACERIGRTVLILYVRYLYHYSILNILYVCIFGLHTCYLTRCFIRVQVVQWKIL